jgi:hypothetical protein
MSKFDLENRELFAMVNRPHGMGGELPCATLHFVPAERAERVLNLDERIQQLKAARPWIIAFVSGISGLVIGLAV